MQQTQARRMQALLELDDKHHCDTSYDMMAEAIAESDDAAGMVLVPRKPTPAMIRAAIDRRSEGGIGDLYGEIWQAMVGAAEGEGDGSRQPDASIVGSGAIDALRDAIAKIHEVQAKIAAAKATEGDAA